jgi:protein-L-isoaspartate(D-aspartate) O-methyltransferase
LNRPWTTGGWHARTTPPSPGLEDLVRAVAAAGIRDERVLAAFREVPRARFVSPQDVPRAYVDEPLPIPHRQVTTQPSLIAKMVEALGLDGRQKVLEVGTGYGFQTAILAALGRFVWSVERWPDLAETASRNLGNHGTDNVEIVVGDGSLGLGERAPFDAILVSAAHPRVPEPLADQLAQGGVLVQPLGWGGNEEVVLLSKGSRGLVRRRSVGGAHFVRLHGRHGFPAKGQAPRFTEPS